MIRRKMLKLFLSLAVGVVVALPAARAGEYDTKIYSDSLDNGLMVYYIVDNSAPVVSTLMYYRAGSMDEKADKAGLAHVMEHMMFGETKAIPQGQITRYIEDAGGIYNAHTSYEEAAYYIKLPASQVKLALFIESQRMKKLKITQEGLEKQKKIILEEINSRDLNQPYSEYYTLAPKIIYDAWPIAGDPQRIKSITVGDLQDYYNKLYQPNNAVLVITGDINLANARAYVREYFNIYESTTLTVREKFVLPKITEDYRKQFTDKKASLPAVFINFRSCGIADTNYYPLRILAAILANGDYSRLKNRLTYKENLASSVEINMEFLGEQGAFAIKAIAEEDADIAKIEAIILEEIKSIIEKGVTQEEMTAAVNYLEAKIIFEKLDVQVLSWKLARFATYFKNPNIINTEVDIIRKITPEKIKAAARAILSTGRKATLFFES